jgi:hypothetical protein
LRAIEDNLLGETMTTVHALVSSEFFDKLISHPKTEDASKFFSATGGQPLREDMRRAFPFAGILFEEYNGSVTLSNGTSERLIPTGEGIAFPLGTFDTFTTYGGPANLLETANTVGLPLYARQMIDAKGRWIDLMTEASILPVNNRPGWQSACTARSDRSGHVPLCRRHRQSLRRSQLGPRRGLHRGRRGTQPGSSGHPPRGRGHRLWRCPALVGNHPHRSACRRGGEPARWRPHRDRRRRISYSGRACP